MKTFLDLKVTFKISRIFAIQFMCVTVLNADKYLLLKLCLAIKIMDLFEWHTCFECVFLKTFLLLIWDVAERTHLHWYLLAHWYFLCLNLTGFFYKEKQCLYYYSTWPLIIYNIFSVTTISLRQYWAVQSINRVCQINLYNLQVSGKEKLV